MERRAQVLQQASRRPARSSGAGVAQKNGAGIHWLHGVQGHECEPEAGKVNGHGLSR